MQYSELVKKVQHYSGFSDQESETALRTFVKKLSSRMTQEERKDFASELPQDLKQLAAVEEESQQMFSAEEFIKQFCEEENIDEKRAKKQIYSAWKAIKDAISPGEVNDIRAQLPNDFVAMLH